MSIKSIISAFAVFSAVAATTPAVANEGELKFVKATVGGFAPIFYRGGKRCEITASGVTKSVSTQLGTATTTAAISGFDAERALEWTLTAAKTELTNKGPAVNAPVTSLYAVLPSGEEVLLSGVDYSEYIRVRNESVESEGLMFMIERLCGE